MTPQVLALSGGVGGAKLALGLSHVVAPEALTVVVNTGDDFEHLGLHVSPDVDTLLYTLAGLNNPVTGWGRDGETWSFMTALGELGGETWFRLGDKDLATNIQRTARLAAGHSLSAVTAELAQALGVAVTVAPMSDAPVRTRVQTPTGWLGFQHYFVKHRCEPHVLGLDFEGSAAAAPSAAFELALSSPSLEAIVICPSNPYLSIDPMLSIPGLRAALSTSPVPVIAVSPIVAGRALKGPTAKIMAELGIQQSALSVARHYEDLLDGFVLDSRDAALAEAIPGARIAVTVANTVMETLGDRVQLARAVLDFARQLAGVDEETTTGHVGTGSC